MVGKYLHGILIRRIERVIIFRKLNEYLILKRVRVRKQIVF